MAGGIVGQLGRPGMPEEMKDELWRRWRAGESISVISRGLGKPPGSVFTVLKYHGGIAPPVRRPRPGRLSAQEREEISRGLRAGASVRAMAAALGRPASTVSREITRNGGVQGYRALAACARAREQARRPKSSALQRNPVLRQTVIELLDQEWSPEQIAGRMRLLQPQTAAFRPWLPHPRRGTHRLPNRSDRCMINDPEELSKIIDTPQLA